MRLAVAQFAMETSLEENLRNVLKHLNASAGQGADLALFPELCLSPFFPQYPGKKFGEYALSVDDEPIIKIRETCANLGISASPNIYLNENQHRFDASLLIGFDGQIQAISKMVHIAQLQGFYEQDYYAPSDTGFHVYKKNDLGIGMVVCFDRHFPESIRTCVLRGASIVLIATANTVAEPRDIFECELRAAAYQNGVFVAMCNRVGVEGPTEFCGESLVVDPDGNVIGRAGSTEQLLICDVDVVQVSRARRARPYLSLRRPEVYG